MNRRRFLQVAAPAGVLGLAGCNSDGDGASPRSSPTTTTAAAGATLSIGRVEVEPETITVGDRITVHVEVTNTGEQAGEKRLRLETAGGTELATQPVSVPAGETVSTTLTTDAAPEAGDIALVLNDQRIGTVTVEEPQTVFYVGPDGSDSNPGTEAEPFETIGTALHAVDPGGTVHVSPGSTTSSSRSTGTRRANPVSR